MTDELDPQLEAALTDTFARRDREVGPVAGNLADVYRRAERRKTRRRALTAVSCVALAAAGVGGLVGLGQLGADAPARGAATTPPVASAPSESGAWFVCTGAVAQPDGSTAYDWCELETPYGNPAWSCSGPIGDPAVDGDDRPRFESCTAVGEAYPIDLCVPVTTVPTSTPRQTIAPVPVTTPVVAPSTTPATTLPPAPVVTWVGGPCDASGYPVPPTTVPTTLVLCEPTPPAVDVPCGTAPAASVPLVTQHPVQPAEQTYVVVAGDSLASIAARHGITLDVLVAYNQWTDDHPLLVGELVRIPPTSLPVESPRVLAIGDSVMLGASDVLVPRGWTVVAQTTLQMQDAVPMVEEMAANGVFSGTEAVIVHVGTNGPFDREQLDALLAPLAEVPNVLVYTVRADRAWTEPNNALLRAVDQPGDNIVLIDWDVRSQECTDDCFAGDGIHLNENGKQFYADLARDWTGV